MLPFSYTANQPKASPTVPLFLCILCAFVVQSLFEFSADFSLPSAATAQQLHSGGYNRAIRCTCVISATSAGPAADTKCQFSGFSAASRPHFSGKCANSAQKLHIPHFDYVFF
jgi:hypothetical protein